MKTAHRGILARVSASCGFALLLALLAGCSRGGSPTSGVDESNGEVSPVWIPVVDSLDGVSYAIGIREDETGTFSLVGSGVAVGPGLIATNAHVVLSLFEGTLLLRQRGIAVTPIAWRNGSDAVSEGLLLDVAGIHTEFRDGVVFSADVATLEVAESLSEVITLPDLSGSLSLRRGIEVGLLGFPGSTLSRFPEPLTATFRQGAITALGAFDSVQASGPLYDQVLQYSITVTPGTSGSPVFDLTAKLVALNNAGAVKRIWDDATGDFIIVPVARVGYGIRADVLQEVLSGEKEIKDTLSNYAVPQEFTFDRAGGISLPDGRHRVRVGADFQTAQATAESLFNVTEPSAIAPDGSIAFFDGISYHVTLYRTEDDDRLGLIRIRAYSHPLYLPAFRNEAGVTLGSSRNFILDNYGSAYQRDFSTDSAVIYLNYPHQGVGFGFLRDEEDVSCHIIQIAPPLLLEKGTEGSYPHFAHPSAQALPPYLSPGRFRLKVEKLFP